MTYGNFTPTFLYSLFPFCAIIVFHIIPVNYNSIVLNYSYIILCLLRILREERGRGKYMFIEFAVLTFLFPIVSLHFFLWIRATIWCQFSLTSVVLLLSNILHVYML